MYYNFCSERANREKYLIAYNAVYILVYVTCAGLDLLVLFAYYRLGKRLTARQVQLLTENLRAEAMLPETDEYSMHLGRDCYPTSETSATEHKNASER